MKKINKNDIKLIAKGVDSLYLYLECNDIISLDYMIKYIEKIGFDESFQFFSLDFIKVRQYLKTYPNCIKYGQYLLFLNRRSIFIKVLSLAFELRGYEDIIIELCELLEKLSGSQVVNWCDRLKVTRIDIYIDFSYDGDFEFDQFRSRLRKRGIFKNAKDAESVTYYFGSRSIFMVRLYVKSSEIEFSGKDYLKSHWKKTDNEESKIWRLEFEYRKDKILELCRFRELSCIDKFMVHRLFSYGVNTLEYVNEPCNDGNLYRKQLHPIWEMLKKEFDIEYKIRRDQVKKSDIRYRFKRVRRCLISWLVAKDIPFNEIDEFYRETFNIDRFTYDREYRRYQIDYKRIKE